MGMKYTTPDITEKRPRSQTRGRVVYVVMGWDKRLTNDRVRKILRLRPLFERMQLVIRGPNSIDEEEIAIRAIPNPLALLRRLKLHRLRFRLEQLLFFPNSHVLFTAVAKRRLRTLVRQDLERGKAVTLVTCVPNHENTAIGLYLKRLYPEIRWVVDWQDLWTYDANYYERVPKPYRPALKRRERDILALADCNVTTNVWAKNVLRDQFGVPEDRLLAVHHHFDREELEPWSGTTDSTAQSVTQNGAAAPKTSIGFLGSLFKPPRVPGMALMGVLRKLREEGVAVDLHLHGRVPPELIGETALLEKSGLVQEGGVAHRQAADALSRYDYVLVLLSDLPNSKVVMSIKLPQYFLAGKPVLALVPGSSAIADIIRETGTGYVIPTDGDWQAELAQFLRDDPQCPAVRNEAAIESFSWDCLSSHWASAISGDPQTLTTPAQASVEA